MALVDRRGVRTATVVGIAVLIASTLGAADYADGLAGPELQEIRMPPKAVTAEHCGSNVAFWA